MTEYEVIDIVRDVRIAIDQNMSESALDEFGDVDTLALNDIIKSKIVDAAMFIFDNAPTNMIGEAVLCNDAEISYNKVYSSDKSYYAEIAIPSTFYRLVSFKMKGWKNPITDEDLIFPTDDEYAIQRSRVEGVRGCAERPVLAYVPNINGGDNEYCFEAYSCTQGDTYAFTYLPMPMIKDEKISLPQKLYKAIVYATAYLTAIAFNADSQAMRLLSVAKQLAGIDEVPIQQQPVVSQYDNIQNVQQ